MLVEGEGPFILTSCKEKEAAWEVVKFMSAGEPGRILTRDRGELPSRKSLSKEPVCQQNRFNKVCLDAESSWWWPPFYHKYWANFQEKIPPYWQQVLQEKISAKEFHAVGAKLLRGQL
jgi:ABC-type glycerol-3-phosphate transport system substrate-binding protein